MSHGNLRLERPHCFQRNTDNNQDRRTANSDIDPADIGEDNWENSNDAQEDGPNKGDFRKNFGNEVAGGFARPDSRDCPAVLAEIIGNFDRIILNCHIEVVKSDNQDKIDNSLPDAGVVENI